MPFSHHSHSGEYVSHGENKLDEIVARAQDMNFRTFCLTEHCPRYSRDLMYPEENTMSVEDLSTTFDRYISHAKRIQKKINSDKSTRMTILVGFEAEGGVDNLHTRRYQELRNKYDLQIIVGSVHYVNRIPIDFDRDLWVKAKNEFSTYKDFFKAYFDCQYDVISKLKPEVVSHFDLIRLFEKPETDRCELTGKLLRDINIEEDWPDVWDAIKRNIDLLNTQGSLIEFNSAAIRKGWDTPYPKRDIVNLALNKGSRFCMSDDSHSIKQVGLNYNRVLEFIKSLGSQISAIYYWDLDKNGVKFVNHMSISDLVNDPFWNTH